MSAVGTDPFSLVEAAIWRKLEANAAFAALVGAGRRVKMSVLEPNVMDSTMDAPELVMIPSGGTVNRPGDGTSSSSESIRQRYSLGINSDTLSTVDSLRGINALKWAILCVFVSGIDTLPDESSVPLTFVRMVRAMDFQDVFTPQDLIQRNVRGWRSVIGLEVVMVFDRSFMTA